MTCEDVDAFDEMDLATSLRNRAVRVAVWGAGFIGFSTAACLAREGIDVVCLDPDPRVTEAIVNARSPVPGLEYWLGFDPAPLIRQHLCVAHPDAFPPHAGPGPLVHFVAVPTEANARPWLDALWDVVGRLKAAAPGGLVILESTLVPGTSDQVAQALPHLDVAAAPRRDWFVGSDKSLRALPRVYGANDQRAAARAANVLSLLCDRLHRAASLREAEIVKAVENAYRHVNITLANQLTAAYPDLDMNAVMRLAATKWNFGEAWRCSLGISGYCLPVAGSYLLEGAERPGALTILKEAATTDRTLPWRVAEACQGYRSVAVLGTAYKDGLHVHQMAVGARLIRELVAAGTSVRWHDPLCRQSPGPCCQVEGAEPVDLDTPLGAEAIVIATGHHMYRTLTTHQRARLVQGAEVVLDNEGAWSGLAPPPDVRYVVPGSAGWLARLKKRTEGRP